MKKIVSLILTVVLLTAVMIIPVTPVSATENAKTYSTEVPKLVLDLNFEGDAPYGIPAHRGNYTGRSNGYVIISQGNKSEDEFNRENGSIFYLGIDGTVGKSSVNAYNNSDQMTEDVNATIFKYQPSTKYRVSLKYKFMEGSYCTEETPKSNVELVVMTDTKESINHVSNSSYQLKNHTSENSYSVVRPEIVDWNTDEDGYLAEDTAWYTTVFTFTTKDAIGDYSIDSLYAGVRPDNYRGYKKIAYDYIKIEVLNEDGTSSETETETKSYSYDESHLHTMENEETTDALGSKNGATEIEFVDSGDEHGKVLKFTAAANGRVNFNDDFYFKKNSKYYISFDGKVETGTPRIVSVIGYGECTSIRYFMTGAANTDIASAYYVDGTQVKSTGFNFSTEWKRYGIILDTSVEAVNTGNASSSAELFINNRKIHLMLGAQTATVYLDNVKIVECTDMPEAIYNTDELPLVQRSIRYAEKKENEYVSAGLRVKGTLERTVRDSADEIGFIVLPALMAAQDYDWFNMNKKNPKYKKAVCYQKNEYGKVIKDVVYSDDGMGELVDYQMILTGLSKEDGKTSYNIRYAFVMYVKKGDTYTYYGLSETSYNEVQALYDVYGIDPTIPALPEP